MSSGTEAREEHLTSTITNAGRVEIVNDKPVFKPTREFLLSFLALCTVALAIAFDATSLSVALPTISSALGGTALEAFWSGTSFLLASTVLQPTVASLSNIFGRKYVSLAASTTDLKTNKQALNYRRSMPRLSFSLRALL
jgi:MFS family permease